MASSGVEAGVGASSLDGPSAEGTAQTGLRACAEEGGWSEGLTPWAHGRHVCSRPDPPSWRMGSSATVGTKGLGDKPAVP